MPSQSFYRPQRGSRSNDDESQYNEPLVPGGSSARNASQRAGDALSNIDDVLGANSAVTPGQLHNAESNPNGPSLSDALGRAAAGAESGLGGGLYNPATAAAGAAGAGGNALINGLKLLISDKDARNKGAIGTILVGLVLTMGTTAILSIPNKLVTEVTAVEKRTDVFAEDATQREVQNMFDNYLSKNVSKALGKSCPTTRVEKSCVAPISGTDPISRAKDKWRQGNVEGRLAEKYNIVFGKDSNGRIYMAAPGLPSNGIDIQDVVDGKTSVFDLPAVSRTDAGRALSDALEKETLYTRAKFYFLDSKLLRAKYGVVQCITACKLQQLQNKILDSIANKKLAAKAFLIRRVVQPRSDTLAIALQCLVASGCDPNKTDPSDASNSDDPTNGERTSQFERDMRSNLADYAAKYGADTLSDLIKEVEKYRQLGSISKYIGQKILEKLAATAGIEVSENAITKISNPVGWTIAAAKVVNFVHKGDMTLRRIVYLANSTAAVALYEMYRTMADEQKSSGPDTHNVDATVLGSFVSSLGPNAKDDGSGATAEATPLYNYMFDNGVNSPTTTGFVNGDASKAYALDNSNNTAYRCQSGQPVHTGTLVCPENDVNWDGDTLTSLSNTWNNEPLAPVVNALAGFISRIDNDVMGPVNDLLGKIVGIIPGVNDLNGLVAKASQGVFQSLISLLPSPVSPDMSGGATSDTLIEGSYIESNDFTHHSLGGEVLSDKQAAAIVTDQQEQDQQNFDAKPLYARIFDKNDEHSLVSQLALAMPTSVGGAARSVVASIVSDPFGKLTHSFATIVAPHKAGAATVPVMLPGKPFGPTYGFPATDPVFTEDPTTYWQEHNCDQQVKDNFKDWNAQTTTDPSTGEGMNTASGSGTNGCMLLQASAVSGAAWFGYGSGGGS
ncbi:MAG TPA: hypothetical protein VHT70_02525 [Candidatus Saccharimonadales bacterium]|nr:hypothetical protein [Candidatus Saccharimonadales bacterium]